MSRSHLADLAVGKLANQQALLSGSVSGWAVGLKHGKGSSPGVVEGVSALLLTRLDLGIPVELC